MTLETEDVLVRRSLRRRLGVWRGLAIGAGILALTAIAARNLPPTELAGGRQIARVTIEGTITEDRAQLRMLRRIADAKNVDGVLVFINSPGGTTTGGEALYEALREVGAAKPVVAQFGTVAASAAYIAGLATDHVVARGNTITGSVGVIFQSPDVSELMAKVGVKMNEIKSGPLKAVPSPYQPMDENGRKTAEIIVADGQRWFLSLVADRRKVATAEIQGLEQGRIFSGREAVSLRLIDEIGGEREAIRYLTEKRGVRAGTRLVDWRPQRDVDWGLFSAVSGMIGALIGREGQGAHAFFTSDRIFGRLTLDGLVSIWHPREN